MQPENEQLRELLLKAIVFVPGVVLGLVAKLSKINREKKLTVKETIYQTSVALSSAWIVYAVLQKYGLYDWSAPASVICGRFGDELLVWLWRMGKNLIQASIKQNIK